MICRCIVTLHPVVTLHAKLSGAVYCYRSCLYATGVLAVVVSLWLCGLLPR